jgi:hypothetical protein
MGSFDELERSTSRSVSSMAIFSASGCRASRTTIDIITLVIDAIGSTALEFFS